MKNFCALKEAIMKVGGKTHKMGENIWKLYIWQEAYPEWIKDFYKSIINISQLKIWKRKLNKTLVQRRHKNDQ